MFCKSLNEKSRFMFLLLITFLCTSGSSLGYMNFRTNYWLNYDGVCEISVNVHVVSVIHGLALKITCTEGGSLQDLSFSADPRFNIFPEGSPYVKPDEPLPAEVGDTEFSIYLGVQDPNGITGNGVIVATMNLGPGRVRIELDDTRGGILHDGSSDTNLDGDGYCASSPWLWPCDTNSPCHPYGDYNGDGLISALDVQGLMRAWRGYDACADFNRDGLISSLDVKILLYWWGSACP